MNANMHGAEAMLAAFEATDRGIFLDRAGHILDFFVRRIAPAHRQRLPEHYREDWTVNPTYQVSPMFRPAGSTPGHSFELGRLLLQHWDLSGRLPTDAPERARRLIEQSYSDAWDPVRGGFAYTSGLDGRIAIATRYWWPVTEAIGAYAALRLADPHEGDDDRYRELWSFAERVLIDRRHGGWFPELDVRGRPIDGLFRGKPDIYHSLQAALTPLSRRLSRLQDALRTSPYSKAGP